MMTNKAELDETASDYTCEICSRVIDDVVDWKEKPGRGEKHPPRLVPTHKRCAFHTCEGMTATAQKS